MNLKDNEGSISPFLIIVFTALILFIFCLIDIFKICEAKDRLHLCGLIGINSTMADYNYELKKDYDLFAFVYQSNFEIENEIKNNILKNINCFGLNGTNDIDVKITNDINLTNKDEIIRQIKENYYKEITDFSIFDLFYDESEIDGIENEKSKVASKDEYELICSYSEKDNRDEIRTKLNRNVNDDIIVDNVDNLELDKITFDDANNDSKKIINKIKKITKSADTLIINDYIFDTFDYLTLDKEFNREKIFDAEIEYILEGNNSQNKNIAGVKNKILLIFYPEKLKEIYQDATKREEAELIAEAVSGWWATEIGVTIVKNLILNAWAFEEANKEYEILINGENTYLKLLGKEVNYKDLLNVFLLIESSDEKIKNMINLINLNMKKYNSLFSMSTSYSKIEIEMTAKEKMQFMIRKCILKEMRFTDEIDIKEKCTYGY